MSGNLKPEAGVGISQEKGKEMEKETMSQEAGEAEVKARVQPVMGSSARLELGMCMGLGSREGRESVSVATSTAGEIRGVHATDIPVCSQQLGSCSFLSDRENSTSSLRSFNQCIS